MHKQHYQRSQTIMGCLDQIQRNRALQKNLSKLYKNVPINKQYNTNEQATSMQKDQFGTTHTNTINRLTVSSKLRMNKTYYEGAQKNKKMSQLLHNRHSKQILRKQQQIYQQNARFVKRLIKVKSQFKQFNPKKSRTQFAYPQVRYSQNIINHQKIYTEQQADPAQNEQEDYTNNFSKLFITDNVNRYLTLGNPKRIQSASAVNRRRQNRRIENDNKHMKDRLISAMSTSNYSQYKVRLKLGKWVKNSPNKGININRSISEHLNVKTKLNNNLSERKSQQQDFLKFNSQDRYKTMKSQPKDSKSRMRIKTQQRRTSKQKNQKKCSQNLIAKLLQQSIQYIQNNEYQTEGQLSDKKVKSKTMQVPGFIPHNKQNQTQSMAQMRRAAMLHFRKIQKLKSTQSKFWQLTNRLEKQKKEKQSMNKINAMLEGA